MSASRCLAFLLLTSCAAGALSEEDARQVATEVVVPDVPRSLSTRSVLDAIDTTTNAAAAPASSPVPDPWRPSRHGGPVPDPWEGSRSSHAAATDGDGKKD